MAALILMLIAEKRGTGMESGRLGGVEIFPFFFRRPENAIEAVGPRTI